MASSFLSSFTNSPLRPPANYPSVQRPNPAVVASASVTDRTAGPVRPSSFYEVLGIPMTASCREIKAAYRKLARTCHPDVVAENSAEEFIKIQAAYSTLSDPDKRAAYDRQVYRARVLSVSALSSSGTMATLASPISGYSGYCTRRNWETDQCW